MGDIDNRKCVHCTKFYAKKSWCFFQIHSVFCKTVDNIFTCVSSTCAAAKQVLEKKHTIDDSPLKLRLYSQPSPQVQDDPRSEESKGLNTISVRGLTSTTSTETLMNYFENKRRSGGGNVENVRLDSKKEVFFVTFEDPQGTVFVGINVRRMILGLDKHPAFVCTFILQAI